MSLPRSFILHLKRRYRVYFNPQTDYWYAAFENDGARQRRSLEVRTRPEAEAAVRRLETDLESQSFNATPVVKQPSRIKWNELQSQFLIYKTSMGKAPKTIDRYRSGLAVFGRYLAKEKIVYVDEVTLMTLDGYNAFRMNKEKRKMMTVHGDAIAIKTTLKWASRPSRGLIPQNPALDWETPRPVVPTKRVYVREEVEALENGARVWLRTVVTMLARTGMRIGELINLRWKDVDLANRLIHIRVRDDWKPKGKADRSIPMHPKVEALIRELPIGEHMLRGPRGGKLKQQHCLDALKQDQARLSLVVGDLHGFRRFFATEMMRAGVDVDTVRQWGGWKSLETMLRYLAEVRQGDSVKVMDQALAKMAVS